MVGAIPAAIDWSSLILGVELLGLPKVPCVVSGVLIGATVAFFLNKYFAFRDRSQQIGRQALRYGLVFSVEVTAHAFLVTALIHGAGLHYAAAKIAADVLVFNVVHLAMLRYVVFPRERAAVTAAAADVGRAAER